ASFKDYGKLSRRSRKEMIAGARVEVAPYKEDPGDFVLWKPSDAGQPGWDSPWGRGRPGWHIECSAMSEAHLGPHFDIHGGGVDLVFPHHENELAQSVCAHAGEPFVNFWVHNGFLSVDSTKMSKSLGNFVTAHEVLKEWPGEVVRLALLSSHYRDPLDWTEERLQQAKQTLDRWYRALGTDSREFDTVKAMLILSEEGFILDEVRESLRDDLNAPLAITQLHGLAGRVHRCDDHNERILTRAKLTASGRILGLLEKSPDEWLRGEEIDGGAIDERVASRAQARKERRFAEADRIRDELAADGIILEDGPGGTTWRRG
ncbi:MAG TPA: cysteine--tRNA ligase, partial [Stellaceae bacterium]|nr:cysteine--tRNA ligase [Stellaceae bacterium]